MNTPALPAYLTNLPRRGMVEKGLAVLGAGSPPYVSIMGNKFTLIDAAGAEEPVATFDPKLGVYLDCCIVDQGDHASKIYYSKPFDPAQQSYSPPDCWSDNGVAPSINAGSPQAKTCTPDPTGVNGCKWAVWGSKTSRQTGKGVPACGKYMKLALALPGDDMIFLLRIPPNSLTNYQSYLAKFASQPFEPQHVMTRIWFDQTQLGTLMFAATNYIDEAMAAFQQKALAAKATDLLVGRSDRPIAQLMVPTQQEAGRPLAAPQMTSPAPSAAPAPIASTTSPTLQAEQAQPGGATTASPTDAASQAGTAPRRRQRRTAAAEAPAAAPAIAPFAQAPAANGPVAGAPFGMAQASPVSAELNQTLDSFFGKPA